MGVKVARFEIVSTLSGDHNDAVGRIKEASQQACWITNCVWEIWRTWHVQNGSGPKILTYLKGLKEWHDRMDPLIKDKEAIGKKGRRKTAEDRQRVKDIDAAMKELKASKPKCDVYAVPKELGRLIDNETRARFPHVHARVASLIIKRVIGSGGGSQGISKRKSAKGSLPGWMSILTYREGQPSFCRPLPVPFDVQSCPSNTAFYPPLENGGNHRLKVKVDRFTSQTKAGKDKADSHVDEFELLTKGRRLGGQRAVLERVISGEYAFKGSSLVWDDRKRKAFALVCYEMPAPEKQPGNGVAFLRPAVKGPWRFRNAGRTSRRGGNGKHISETRRRLLTQRWSRQQCYRYAGSSNKGHGRKRALQWVQQFSRRWKDFVKTANHVLTSQIVRECQERGAGKLVYFQPSDYAKDTRFLTTAGKIDGRTDSTGWDWHQVKSMLEYKCEAAGIHLEVRKSQDPTRAVQRREKAGERSKGELPSKARVYSNGSNGKRGGKGRSKRPLENAATK